MSFMGKMWILGGFMETVLDSMNDVWNSNTGESWAQAVSGADWKSRFFHAAVVFDNRMWILGGANMVYTGMEFVVENMKDVWWSGDGLN